MSELPVVCTLSAETVRTRRDALLPALFERADRREPSRDGYRLRFRPGTDILTAITSTVDAERQCCRFLRFELTVEPDGGPVWLTMSGPFGTREFLDALIERA
jgi:hypothetical protein